MRITEHRMIELASQSIATQRGRVAQAGQELSSGERVSTPSQDPAAWAASRRADAARVINTGRGEVLARSQDQLGQVDEALGQIGDALKRARELAILAANEVMSPETRQGIQAEVHGLRQSVTAAANTRSADGEYLLAGSRSDQPAFDQNGVYQGDEITRSIEARDGMEQEVGISGSVLTASAGVDVFAELDAFEAAIGANDRDAINAAVSTLRSAHEQVSLARADGGAQSATLRDAQTAQATLDDSLLALHSRLVGADPIDAASELAQHSQALEAAQTVASRIADLTRP